MLNKIVIVGAVLLGSAVPSSAQFGPRIGGAERGPQRADRVEREVGPSRHTRVVSRDDHRHRHGHRGPHYRTERVWVPGCVTTVLVPAQYEWRAGACGERFRVLVRPAYYKRVQQPGHWEFRRVVVRGPHASLSIRF